MLASAAMATLVQFLLILHVLTSMYWFGATASVPRRLREALACQVPEARARVAGLGREAQFFVLSGILVFLTGLGMALIRGFAALPPRIHAGLGLTVLWLGIGLGLLRPTLQKIAGALASAASVPESTGPLYKRAAMLIGIQHMLFTAITVLMLWRI